MGMIDVSTARLILHAVDVPQAERIRDRAPGENECWVADYPFEGDLDALRGFLRASEQRGDQRPFGYYQISCRSDGLVVGGIGFIGPPVGGVVEVGYGLAPSARGNGYAAEALSALRLLAGRHGVSLIRADTTHDNIASQRTMERAGLSRVRVDAELVYYEAPAGPAPS